MGYQSFKELRVWQAARELAVTVYRLGAADGLSRDFGLRNQMRGAAVSVAANIAEGYERNSDKDFVRFLFIAKGSLGELRTHLEIAAAIGYLTPEAFEQTDNYCVQTGSMLTNLIKARRPSSP